jgi:hypothetical protein
MNFSIHCVRLGTKLRRLNVNYILSLLRDTDKQLRNFLLTLESTTLTQTWWHLFAFNYISTLTHSDATYMWKPPHLSNLRTRDWILNCFKISCFFLSLFNPLKPKLSQPKH